MPSYREFPTDEVRVAHFNPAKRVHPNTLTGLLLNVQQNGIMQPLVLTWDLILADGHRRLACAHRLKLTHVPVAIYQDSKMSAPELWVTLNGDTMNLTAAQWLAAVSSGLPLDTPGFPVPLKLRITKLLALVGPDQLAVLAEQGRSPLIMDAVERMVNYVERKGDEKFLRDSLNWLISTGNAWAIRGAMDARIPVDVLVEAVEEGREIGRVWDLIR